MSYITKKLNKIVQKETYVRFGNTLKYAFYVISHPADGMWDLTHAKRGSYAAANFIVLLTVFTHIWKLHFTSFLFLDVNWEEVNVLMHIASNLRIFIITQTTLLDKSLLIMVDGLDITNYFN